MKTSIRMYLRNVAISFACLAAVTVFFASCEKENDPAPDTGTEQEADIVAFSFAGIDGTATIDKAAHTVSAKAGETADLNAIAAEFTLSRNATVKVGGATQESGVTVNNFTVPVIYKVTSGDGQTVNDWTVSVTGGKTPPTAKWEKLNTANFGEYCDFFPTGTFLVQTEGEDIAWLFARNADGSLITSKIYRNPSSQSYNQNYEYRIWHEDMYYWVNHDYLYAKTGGWMDNGEIIGDIFHTLSLKTPGGTIRNPQRMTIDAPYGGAASAVAGDYNPLNLSAPFHTFVNDYNRDEAVFEKNDETIVFQSNGIKPSSLQTLRII